MYVLKLLDIIIGDSNATTNDNVAIRRIMAPILEEWFLSQYNGEAEFRRIAICNSIWNRTRAINTRHSLMHGDKLAIAFEWFHNYEHDNKSKMSDALAEEIARASLIFDS